MSEETTPLGAQISDCGKYRYRLWRPVGRPVDNPTTVLWVMLNPSTADASEDDPTIRKVIGFSDIWSFQRIMVVNLFALRSRDPRALKTHPEPVGPRNDDVILDEAKKAQAVVFAWGANADPLMSRARSRAAKVMELIHGYSQTNRFHLGLTRGGQPKHPLMLPYSTRLVAMS